jgi:hypothetical protein
MTAPTKKARFSVAEELREVNSLFQRGAREEALKRFGQFPSLIKDGVYKCLYQALSSEIKEHLGHDLFWNCNDCVVEDVHRISSIAQYLNSREFKAYIFSNALEKGDNQGSLQEWIGGATKRVYEMITQERGSGGKLKRVEKNVVHLYALLGLIKGQRDGSCGNVMVSLSEKGDQILYFHEFDDEKSLPTQNTPDQFRLWQLGLPQASQPFDRAFLLLFADKGIVEKLEKMMRMHKIPSSGGYEARLTRVKRIRELFCAELRKEKPELTPQELFFQVVGGKETYDQLKSQGFSDWHIFEFCLASEGRGGYFPQEGDQTILQQNFSELLEGGGC